MIYVNKEGIRGEMIYVKGVVGFGGVGGGGGLNEYLKVWMRAMDESFPRCVKRKSLSKAKQLGTNIPGDAYPLLFAVAAAAVWG